MGNKLTKNTDIVLLLLLFLSIWITGCNKFLDVQPKGVQTLKSVSDYDLWLNASTLIQFSGDSYDMDEMADHIDWVELSLPITSPHSLMYSWASQFTQDITQGADAEPWDIIYNRIYYYNVLLNHIDAATDGTTQQKNSLKAEALLGRASEYFLLTNLYAQPYNAASSSNDLSVPFVTNDDITEATPARSMSVSDMYAKIISDINTAIPNLATFNPYARTRGSQLAAYSILARIYLFMNDYTNAAKYAAMAIDNSDVEMISYDGQDAYSLPALNNRVDVIYGRTFTTTSIECDSAFILSNDFNDLRLSANYLSTAEDYGPPTTPTLVTRGVVQFIGSAYAKYNSGTGVAEMLLILAESAARANDLSTAITYLNTVRQYRFADSTFVPLSATGTSQEQVLSWVIRERGFEMPFGGMRWLDMRRLDAEGLMSTVYHTNADESFSASLSPHSARYTLQIPNSILKYNPNMPQNP